MTTTATRSGSANGVDEGVDQDEDYNIPERKKKACANPGCVRETTEFVCYPCKRKAYRWLEGEKVTDVESHGRHRRQEYRP